MKLKFASTLLAIMLVTPVAVTGTNGNTVEASTPTQQKIMWGQNELSPTQIGRIVFNKDVKLYKRDSKNVPSFHLNAKKGSMWRVHKITNEGGKNIYDLGGGVRVQQSSLSTYEQAPNELVEQQVKQYGAKIENKEYGEIAYPQVVRLASSVVEKNINSAIFADAYKNARLRSTHRMEGNYYYAEYKVLENKDNLLVIFVNTEERLQDSEGIPRYSNYEMVFDIATGMRIQ